MLEAFFDSDSCVHGIFKGVKTETEWGISVKNIVEKLSALFYFQVVRSIKSSFVDSASKISFFSFSFSTADEDIKSKYIINSKLLRIYSLLEGLFIDDDLISVNQVFLQFMR